MDGPMDQVDDDDYDCNSRSSPRTQRQPINVSNIPCDPLVTQEVDIRTDEGILIENVNLSMIEGDGKENGEDETRIKDKEISYQTDSNREATSYGDKHLLLSTNETDTVVQTVQRTNPPSHSTISQQTVVSHSHGE